MKRGAIGILALVLSVALSAAATWASGASAAPVWKFGVAELKEPESIGGGSGKSSLTIPGIGMTCNRFPYEMTVFNEASVAEGEITEAAADECATNTTCDIESLSVEGLPWKLRGATVEVEKKLANYIIVEGVKITVVYVGDLCALDEIPVTYAGSAGAKYDSASGTFTLSAANSKATGAQMKALGSTAEWTGVFSTEALGLHGGEALRLE